MIVIGLLEAVDVVALRAVADVLQSTNARPGELSPQLALPIVKRSAERRGSGVRGAVQEGAAQIIERAIHAGRDDAHTRLDAANVLLRAQHGVVRQRLDGLVVEAVDAR